MPISDPCFTARKHRSKSPVPSADQLQISKIVSIGHVVVRPEAALSLNLCSFQILSKLDSGVLVEENF